MGRQKVYLGLVWKKTILVRYMFVLGCHEKPTLSSNVTFKYCYRIYQDSFTPLIQFVFILGGQGENREEICLVTV